MGPLAGKLRRQHPIGSGFDIVGNYTRESEGYGFLECDYVERAGEDGTLRMELVLSPPPSTHGAQARRRITEWLAHWWPVEPEVSGPDADPD